MKKLCSLFLALLTVLSLLPAAAFAAADEAAEAAEGLYSLGLFQGTGTNADGTPIYSLDRVPTRNQAIIMLIRLLGREDEALAGSYETPFTDITSANMAQYIGYAYENGLSNGVSATAYGGERTVKANQYITFVLRALGYVSGEDFTVSEACRFADGIGLTNGEYTAGGKFTRGDVALVSLHALYMEKKSGGHILDTLPSRIEYKDLLAAVNAGRRAEMARAESFDGFTDYLVEDPSAKALLTQAENCTIVKSSKPGVAAHDGFNWEVLGTAFLRCEHLSRRSRAFDETMQEMLQRMDQSERAEFIDTFFDLLCADGAVTLTDINEHKLRSALELGRELRKEKTVQRFAVDAAEQMVKEYVGIVIGQSRLAAVGRLARKKTDA